MWGSALILLIQCSLLTDKPKAASLPKAIEWPAGNAIMSRFEMCKPENRTLLGRLRIAASTGVAPSTPTTTWPRDAPDSASRSRWSMPQGPDISEASTAGDCCFAAWTVRRSDCSTAPHAARPMNDAVFKCSLNPKVQNALLLAAKQSIDIGMDGLILDSWQGEARALCFCDYCLEFYRQCLVEHRDDNRLKDLSPLDAREFNYGEYLRNRGLDAKTPAHKLPFGPVFEEYRFAELIERKRRLLTEIRQYGQRRRNAAFHLTANVYSMQPMTFAIDDLFGLLLGRTPLLRELRWLPASCSSIALLKKAHASANDA